MGKLTDLLGAALGRSSAAEDPRRNAINVIAPYRHHGMWVFDDPRVGLRQEPFVSGADDWLTRVTADVPGAEKGFTLVFSGRSFPGAQYRMERRRLDMGGAWYWSPQLEMEGWLCSALFRYFEDAPEELHVQVRPRA